MRIEASKNLKKLSLLYVEDEDAIREPFKIMIERYFKKIFIATNGLEAVEIFKQNSIDIIITDIRMPIMNGLDMAKEIKKIDNDIPIIFATAFGDREYLKEAIEIGVEGYIIKPIDRNKLFKRLNFIADSLCAKKEIEQYTKLVELLFNYQKDALVLFDKDFNIKLYNKSFQKLLNTKNKPTSLKNLIEYCQDENGNPIDISWFYTPHKKPLICTHKNGLIRYFDIDLKYLEYYRILSITDITDYKIETENIKEIAMIDELTSLYNRKKMDLIKEHLINQYICFIMFDIDDFKAINDTYGHLKGDEVLKMLAKNVKNSLRESDLVIRWGGEEFLIILQHLSNIDIAVSLSEKLRKKINHIKIKDVGHFSCSFGVSCGYISKEHDIKKILNRADEALYLAKRKGKNRVEKSE